MLVYLNNWICSSDTSLALINLLGIGQGMQKALKITLKAEEILDRYGEDVSCLLTIAYNNLRTCFVRLIWAYCTNISCSMSTLTEKQVRFLLYALGIDDKCRKVIKHVKICANGMSAAEISALNLSLIMPKSIELKLKSECGPVIMLQRPALSDNKEEYARELYKVLLSRDKENPLYQLECDLSKSQFMPEEKITHLAIPAGIPKNICDVVAKKIDEIFEAEFEQKTQQNPIKEASEWEQEYAWFDKLQKLS